MLPPYTPPPLLLIIPLFLVLNGSTFAGQMRKLSDIFRVKIDLRGVIPRGPGGAKNCLPPPSDESHGTPLICLNFIIKNQKILGMGRRKKKLRRGGAKRVCH